MENSNEQKDECVVKDIPSEVDKEDVDCKKDISLESGKNCDESEGCSTTIKKEERMVNKRKFEEETPLLEDILTVFLKVFYPLSRCFSKFVVIGASKKLECRPIIMIVQSGKVIAIQEESWKSIVKRMPLIDQYLVNNVYGRKTCFRPLESDLEVENIKLRNMYYVRFKDLTKHDLKVQLSYEEFAMLHSAAPSIINYIKQLNSIQTLIKDYVDETMDIHPNSQLIVSGIDQSIFNRLPLEVHLFRRMKVIENLLKKEERELLSSVIDEDDQSTVCIKETVSG